MKKILILFVAIALITSACNTETKTLLFNGKNLNNWTFFLPDSVNADEVFYVVDDKIFVSGIPNGYLKTKETYSNYQLHVEWRWIGEPTNSGVFLHATGEDMNWPNCMEAQLKDGKAGDLLLMGKGTGITVKGEEYMVESEENRYLVLDKFNESSENPAGEWNTYEITVTDQTVKLVVNDVLQNEGINPTKKEGHICLQSEGGPMEFRNVYLKKL